MSLYNCVLQPGAPPGSPPDSKQPNTTVSTILVAGKTRLEAVVTALENLENWKEILPTAELSEPEKAVIDFIQVLMDNLGGCLQKLQK